MHNKQIVLNSDQDNTLKHVKNKVYIIYFFLLLQEYHKMLVFMPKNKNDHEKVFQATISKLND